MKRKSIEVAKNILEDSDSNEDLEDEIEGVSGEDEDEDEGEDSDVDDGDNDENGGSDEDDGSEADDLAASDDDSEDDDDLAASATDSDEDSAADESEEPKTRADIIKNDVLQRYEERQGKQLYIRFPHKIPNTEEELEQMCKELSPLIKVHKVHKPRQKHARFCLVDFNSKEDRDTALKTLRNSIQKGELAKYVVNIPRTESIEYVNELAERKIKSVENKKNKARLKKASKKALIQKIFTPTVVVLNLPKTASVIQLRELFPNAVDIQIKAGKGKLNKSKSIASVTLPSTIDARKAVKQKFSLDGNQLMVKFDNQTMNKKKTKPQQEKKQLQHNKNAENVETPDKCEPENKKRKLESNEEAPTKDSAYTPKKPKANNNNGQNKKNKSNKKSQKVVSI